MNLRRKSIIRADAPGRWLDVLRALRKCRVGMLSSVESRPTQFTRHDIFRHISWTRYRRGQPPLRRAPSESSFAATSPPTLWWPGRPPSIPARRLRAVHPALEVLQPSAVADRDGCRAIPAPAAAPWCCWRGADEVDRSRRGAPRAVAKWETWTLSSSHMAPMQIAETPIFAMPARPPTSAREHRPLGALRGSERSDAPVPSPGAVVVASRRGWSLSGCSGGG